MTARFNTIFFARVKTTELLDKLNHTHTHTYTLFINYKNVPDAAKSK